MPTKRRRARKGRPRRPAPKALPDNLMITPTIPHLSAVRAIIMPALLMNHCASSTTGQKTCRSQRRKSACSSAGLGTCSTNCSVRPSRRRA